MNINTAFPSKYVAAADLQGQAVDLVIRAVLSEDIGQGEEKPVVYFEGQKKGWVLNKTNGLMIAQMYGDETDHWIGRPVTIRPEVTPFKGELVDCIRVVPGQPQPPSQVTPQPVQSQPTQPSF